MTKKDLEQFQSLKRELERKRKKIEREERRAAAVPIVKDKVQSSQKEWPFIRTHETVDAPEAKQYTIIQRRLYLLRLEEAALEQKLLELEAFIRTIEDSRTRLIVEYRYAEGHTLKDTAIAFDMTEQGVLYKINQLL